MENIWKYLPIKLNLQPFLAFNTLNKIYFYSVVFKITDYFVFFS